MTVYPHVSGTFTSFEYACLKHFSATHCYDLNLLLVFVATTAQVTTCLLSEAKEWPQLSN